MPIGTKPTAPSGPPPKQSGLTAVDICAIIEAAAKSRVAYLSFGELRIKFDSGLSRFELSSPLQQWTGGEGGHTGKDAEPPEMVIETPEDRELAREAQLAQLLTHDPMAYEQAMIDALVGTDGPTDDE